MAIIDEDFSGKDRTIGKYGQDGTVHFKDNAGNDIVASPSICKNFGHRWDYVQRKCVWKKDTAATVKTTIGFRGLRTKVMGHFNKLASSVRRFLVVGYNNELQGENENGVVFGSDNILGTNAKNTSILGGAEHEVGYRNTASTEIDVKAQYCSVLGGRAAFVKRYGEQVLCAGGTSDPDVGTSPGCQTSVFIFTGTTTDNTATELFLLGDSSNRLNFIDDNFLMTFTADFMAYQTGGSSGTAGDSHSKRIQGTINKVGDVVGLVGSVSNSLAKSSTLAITFSATADNTNKSLKIEVTGQNNKNVTHVVVVKTNQIRIAV